MCDRGQVLLKDVETIRISFSALEQLFFDERQYIVGSASFRRLTKGFRHGSNYSKASPKYLFLMVLNKLIYVEITSVLFGWHSNVLTSLILYKEMVFIAADDFHPLFNLWILCPITSFFFNFYVWKLFYHCSSGLSTNYDETSANFWAGVADLSLVGID